MTCLIYRSLLVFCTALCAISLSAQDSKRLAALPTNGFDFAGTWGCEGAFRNKKIHRSIYTGSAVLDGKWLELTERDTEPVSGYVAKYLIGYDPNQKQLVEFDANSFGTAVYSSEMGWQNGVLVMTSPISSDAKATYVINRFVYSITGKDSFTVEWQISRTSTANWETADHLSCTRAPMQ
ncbi:hypothetical protein [Occallatibacter riparius]|uniref:DUF1579 domain-containing protein n=1 Tax=Occallatibacter riparius TaxID=1002689 RepID=A0A9J7BPJ1_9BACT|nr:hypothetical protein [Occallatibacter riparius]UWZ82846.1 hypothetical protein MOP44_20035 [Occallatibacter riparius]